MPAVVNVDGVVVGEAEARVSAFDHGFLYGDSVYETIRVYSGRPFHLDRHLARLAASARAIGLDWPIPAAELAREVERTLAAAGEPEAALRLVLTRGVGPIGIDPKLCPRASFLIYARPYLPVPAECYEDGVTCIVATVVRNSPRALDPAIKSGNFLNNILAQREAAAAAAFEALLLNQEATLAEATQSNVFVIREGKVATPDLASGILPGITREIVLDLLRRDGTPAAERPVFVTELYEAEEVWLTSTLKEIVPVVRLGQRPVGCGRPGAIYRRLRERFAAEVAALRAASPPAPAELRTGR